VLVPAEHEVDARTLEALERVTGVVDDVALTPRAGHGQQMVVHDEDLEVGGRRELLLDPPVAAAPDLAVVDVRRGRVDGDDRDAVDVEHRAALAEQLLEVDEADVPGVVVARDDDETVALEPVEVLPGLAVLPLEAGGGEVARADHDVGPEVVDLGDRALHELGHEVRVAAVDVRDVRDREAP
jgi:hypothetical protein